MPERDDSRGGRILVVDDSAVDREYCAAILTRGCMEVVTAATGGEALRIAQTQPLDAVVCDLHMPEMDGMALLKGVHNVDPDLPLVIMSGDDDVSAVLKATREGAFDYVLKSPEGRDRLPITVDRAVRHVRAVRRNHALSLELLDANRTLESRVAQRTAELREVVGDLERNRTELQAALTDLSAKERLASLGMLAATVAHEVNNPAAFIITNMEHLRGLFGLLRSRVAGWRGLLENETSSAARHRIESILDLDNLDALLVDTEASLQDNLVGMERIRSVVDELRMFARSGERATEPLDINAVVQTASRIVRNEVRHRAELVLDLGEVTLLEGDHSRLTQVLVNLLLNSAHAITEGSANDNRIRVATYMDGDELVVEVEDSGSGIPQTLRSQVFEPFFTTKPAHQGTGLGLALCTQIVRDHQGVLKLERTLGQGTRMTMRFPGVSERAPEDAAKAPPSAAVSGLRILIIDDEPALLRALARRLGRANSVDTALGGAEGLNRLEKCSAYDIILCDIMMPEVDGVMVHQALEQRAPETLNRLVFTTGGAFTERARSFTVSSGCLVLDKPITTESLRAAYEQVVERSSAAGRPHDVE